MKPDLRRDAMPRNACWNMVDAFPWISGAPLQTRGGWTYASNDLSSTVAGSSRVVSIGWCPFPGDESFLVIDEDENLFQITPPSLTVNRITGAAIGGGGTGVVGYWQVLFWNASTDQIAIFPHESGSIAPRRATVNPEAIATLGGTPPTGRWGAVHQGRLALAGDGTVDTFQNVYWSEPNDPESWNGQANVEATDFPVTGLAVIRNLLLVFSEGHVQRFRGTPPSASTDLTLDTLTDNGCNDPRTIANWKDNVIWANPDGVYMTDGVSVSELTSVGGISKLYRSRFIGTGNAGSNYDGAYNTTWILSGGVWQDFYVMSIVNDAGSFVDSFICHIPTRTWARMTNVPGTSWATAQAAADLLYFGLNSAPRVASFSPTFSPTSSNKNDANSSSAPRMSVEGAFVRGTDYDVGVWRDLLVQYDLRDAASDNPTLTLSYATSPELESYTAVTDLSTGSGYTLAETTAEAHARRRVAKRSRGISWKLAQTNAASACKVFAVDATVYRQDGYRN